MNAFLSFILCAIGRPVALALHAWDRVPFLVRVIGAGVLAAAAAENILSFFGA